MKHISLLTLLAACIGCAQQNSATTTANAPSMDMPRQGSTGTVTPAPNAPNGPADRPLNNDPTPTATTTPVAQGDEQTVGIREPLDSEIRIVPRPRRRLNVDQLRAAMEQVSGGIEWSERRGGQDVNLFEQLSDTLGKPNYVTTTDEDLDPTVLFQKFLGDAARNVCTKMLQADLAALETVESGENSEWSPRLMIHAGVDDTHDTAPDHISANIQFLVQRFHGRRLADDAPGLAHWHWLFRTSVFVTDSPTQAWLGVCVGLFTHPDFYMY